MIILNPDHDTSPTGWLGYSHTESPPTDRPVIDGKLILKPIGVTLANWYFVNDDALKIIGDSKYRLVPLYYQKWQLVIADHSRAALFKLRFM